MSALNIHQTYQKISTRRMALLVLIAWVFLIAGSLGLNMRQVHKTIYILAEQEAETHFNKDAVYRRWAALQGGLYVLVSDFTPPNPHLAHIKERDVTTLSGRKLTLVNPAYMTRQVHDLSAEQYGVRGHLTSLKPVRPETAPDEWEVKALQQFEDGESAVRSLAIIDGEPFLRFMRSFITDPPCLKCHAYQGYVAGDVRGGIGVAIPMAPYYALRANQYKNLLLWHLLLFVAGVAGIVLGSRFLHEREVQNRAAWRVVDLDRERIASLLKISQERWATEEELIRFALEEYVRLTRSPVGYFHFYDEATETIQLFAWCKDVMTCCQVPALDQAYPLAKAGVWADSLRSRRPAIQNDYQNMAHKTGCPDGHLPMIRHLSVPVMDGDRIVAIAGVGNKETLYESSDVTQLTLYGNTMWEIVKNLRAVIEIEKKEQGLRLFRILVDHSSDAIFIVSPEEGIVIDVNERACEVLGYGRDELVGLGVADIDVGQPEGFRWDLHVEKLRQGPGMLMESRHRRKDGTSFPVEVTIKVVALTGQEFMIGAARDISERKRAEEALQAQQDNLEHLVKERTENLAGKTEELEKSRAALQFLLEDVSEGKTALEEKVAEIERMNRVFVDRELRMVELKQQIKGLEDKLRDRGGRA